MYEFNFKFYDTSKQSISYCEVDKCKAVVELKQQLDQLKSDNDNLKSELMQTNCYLEADKEIIDQLKTEVDELKKQTCGLRPELKYIIDKTCYKYNINAKYYHEKIVEIINNLDKYKQTLIKIKDIAKPWYTLGSKDSPVAQILQKISECEVSNEN